MAILRKAVGANHNHFALIDNDGSGITSKTNRHVHLIQRINVGNDEQPKFETQILPGKDGHTHNIKPVKFKKKKTKEADDASRRFLAAIELANASLSSEEEYRELAEESDKFYMGGDGQWDPAVLEALKVKKQAAISLNLCKVIVNILYGYYKQNPLDIKYSPQEDGDAKVADMCTHLISIVLEQNNYTFEKNEVFLDLLIGGRGNFNAYIDGPKLTDGSLVFDEKNIEGRIVIERQPWDLVSYGPHTKKNGDDIEYEAIHSWISLGKLKSLAPHKAEAIAQTSYFDGGNTWKYKINDRDDLFKVDPENLNNLYPNAGEWVDIKTKRLRHTAVYRKEFVFENFIVDMNSESEFEIKLDNYDITPEEIKQLLTISRLEKITKSSEEIWETKFCCNVHLGSQRLDVTRLPVTPAYGIKRGNDIQGKIEDLKDPQRERNKRRSTVSDQANKTGQNWFLEPDTLDETQNTVDQFTSNVTGNGGVFILNEGKDPPSVEKGIEVDPSLISLDEKSEKDIEKISGVDLQLLSRNTNVKSGLLFQEIKDAALRGNEIFFEGMSNAQRTLGYQVLELMALTFTPEKVYRMLNNRHTDSNKPPVEIGGAALDTYDKETIERLWDPELIKLNDVVVTESEHSPTKRIADFKSFGQIIGQVSDPSSLEFMLELSDLPPKKKAALSAILQRGSQQKMAEAQLRSDTEMQKTLVANQPSG